jgi:hypothetical protein
VNQPPSNNIGAGLSFLNQGNNNPQSTTNINPNQGFQNPSLNQAATTNEKQKQDIKEIEDFLNTICAYLNPNSILSKFKSLAPVIDLNKHKSPNFNIEQDNWNFYNPQNLSFDPNQKNTLLYQINKQYQIIIPINSPESLLKLIDRSVNDIKCLVKEQSRIDIQIIQNEELTKIIGSNDQRIQNEIEDFQMKTILIEK